ncbi:MAG: hypothetical protein HC897_11715 [Thermoanaerobaculia bacterium]|nr:hypothetical protein [Thermoanaerobaculia bacterium]
MELEQALANIDPLLGITLPEPSTPGGGIFTELAILPQANAAKESATKKEIASCGIDFLFLKQDP